MWRVCEDHGGSALPASPVSRRALPAGAPDVAVSLREHPRGPRGAPARGEALRLRSRPPPTTRSNFLALPAEGAHRVRGAQERGVRASNKGVKKCFDRNEITQAQTMPECCSACYVQTNVSASDPADLRCDMNGCKHLSDGNWSCYNDKRFYAEINDPSICCPNNNPRCKPSACNDTCYIQTNVDPGTFNVRCDMDSSCSQSPDGLWTCDDGGKYPTMWREDDLISKHCCVKDESCNAGYECSFSCPPSHEREISSSCPAGAVCCSFFPSPKPV